MGDDKVLDGTAPHAISRPRHRNESKQALKPGEPHPKGQSSLSCSNAEV